MSLGARATKGGAKAGKEKTQEKGKPDKPQPKEKVKPQATTEQLRMAHMIDRKNDDASDVRRMVLELMEMTRRTEEEVCSALHDSDNDMVAACNLLLEDTHRIQGEWQTNEKKKKKPVVAGGNGEAEPPRDPEARSRSGPRPRRGEGEGGRGAGRGGGSGRGRGGARGAARGGRGGGRGRAPPRRPRHEPGWDDHVGGMGPPGVTDSFPATEDWDNEEWSGSLSDTKVFTPSAAAQQEEAEQALAAQEDWDNPEPNGPVEPHIPTYTYHNTLVPPAPAPAADRQLIEQISGATNHAHSEVPQLDHTSYRTTPHHQPMGMSGSLSAAQSQYLSALTAAAAARAQPPDQPPPPSAPAPAPASYQPPTASLASLPQEQPRKPQRARVPPPSKIPSSAVEMPGGEGSMFLDVQFGALEPDTLAETASVTSTNSTPTSKQQVPMSESTTAVSVSAHENAEPPSNYANANSTTNSMLNESLSVVDSSANSQQQPVTSEPIVTSATTSLEKQLSAGMKQLSVSEPAAVPHYTHTTANSHHRPKGSSVSGVGVGVGAGASGVGVGAVSAQQTVYHHAVSHHPPVYGANVYAPQVNSTNASLTGASAMTATQYPSSVTLTQYQPILNSYQQTSSSATVYGGSALYTGVGGAGGGQPAYTPYQPAQPKMQQKDNTSQQYESSVPSSNSLTSTSTTQASTAKVATTTVSAAGVGGVGGVGGASSYAAGALYGGTSATYAQYDDQMMRSTLPHHMGGYYEVGYGVTGVTGVTGAREGSFGLGGGERFGRADAASPQQVPAPALPPGYAYFYQPPPTTYQYGVYPTYGGGSNVGGVGGVSGGGVGGGKLSSYAPQQPPYEQDSYKPGGPYTGNTNKSAGGAAADLTNAIYAKTHVALNKVNSYEKAAFHSGTPPPFGAGSHLYIPAPPHHHPHHHAPQQHQMDARVSSSHTRRQESASGGGRANAAKPASKPNYSQSYWAPN